MIDPKTSKRNMSPGLARVAARVRKQPKERLRSLAHHLDRDALKRAYRALRADAAVGADGVTKEAYGKNLEENLQELHSRMRMQKYRHQPIRRIHIPKEDGRSRPIGVSCTEDKIVQGALHELLETIYEEIFVDFSYGFRPGRSAHDALSMLDRCIFREGMQWILEFDIKSFFDSVDRAKLRDMLQEQIADRSLLRLIGKCLNAGVLEAEELQRPEVGTVQGSRLSPLLGNIYLHHVLDKWFVEDVAPRMAEKAVFIRYADDGVFGFRNRSDAERVMAVLGKRLARYGLVLHPTKTRLLDFRRPPEEQKRGKGPDTFDLLGFTLYWRRSRAGKWYLASKTKHARVCRTKKDLDDWCRRHRHLSVKTQHAALVKRLQGHLNYFGVRGNTKSLLQVSQAVRRSWFKWLNRRGQRSKLTWKRFEGLIAQYPLPEPRAKLALWGAPL